MTHTVSTAAADNAEHAVPCVKRHRAMQFSLFVTALLICVAVLSCSTRSAPAGGTSVPTPSPAPARGDSGPRAAVGVAVPTVVRAVPARAVAKLVYPVHCEGDPALAGSRIGRYTLYPERQSLGERIRREPQRQAARRVAEPGAVPELAGRTVRPGRVAPGVQSPPAAQRIELADA